jgi:opacity protein-like surface antigen
MRVFRRISLALLMALAVSVPVYAQSVDDRFSFNAAVGPSFANLGTTLSARAGMDVRVNDRVSFVGEFGMLPHAPFEDARTIAAPAPFAGAEPSRVNAYHWNGNLRVRPLESGRFEPYITGGIGSFTADTILNDQRVGVTRIEERRRTSDFATNVGAGVMYRLNDWMGVGADYRTFFVHRDHRTPRVNRFTMGVTFNVN